MSVIIIFLFSWYLLLGDQIMYKNKLELNMKFPHYISKTLSQVFDKLDQTR